MQKLPLLVLLVTVVVVAAESLDDVIAELARRRQTNDSTLQPRTGADNSCLKDGEEGECVLYYQCNENGTFNEYGNQVIDIRSSDSSGCASYLQTCCLQNKKRPTRKQPPVKNGCGWRNSAGVGFRIVGAEDNESEFAEFPWMVAILEKSSYGSVASRYLGGGSLIHPSIVLTGARIVYNHTAEDLKTRAGDWDTTSTEEEYPYQETPVCEVVIHAQYDNGALHNDIALLFLMTPVTLAPNVGLVCLPPRDIPPAHGSACVVTGWGKDRFEKGKLQAILKKVEVPVIGPESCQRAFRETRLGKHFRLHETFVCAGGEGHDACKGDGGSPLVCPSTEPSTAGRYIQYGIVAWGIGCGGPPGVYANVAHFRAWVDGHVTSRGYDTASYTL